MMAMDPFLLGLGRFRHVMNFWADLVLAVLVLGRFGIDPSHLTRGLSLRGFE